MVTKEEIVIKLTEAQRKLTALTSRSDADELEQLIASIRTQRKLFLEQGKIRGDIQNTLETRKWSQALEVLAKNLKSWKEPEVIVEKKAEATVAEATEETNDVTQLTSSTSSENKVSAAATETVVVDSSVKGEIVSVVQQLKQQRELFDQDKSIDDVQTRIVIIQDLLKNNMSSLSELDRFKFDNIIEQMSDDISYKLSQLSIRDTDLKYKECFQFARNLSTFVSSNRKEIRNLMYQVKLAMGEKHRSEYDTYEYKINESLMSYDAAMAKDASKNLEERLQHEPGFWRDLRTLVNEIVRLIAQNFGASKESNAYKGKWWTSQATKNLHASGKYDELKTKIDEELPDSSTGPTPGSSGGDEL